MSKRILIIEDDDDIREVASATLEISAGWEVLTAASGGEGVERAAAERPDAILLDVMMPDMDGPTTFRRLRESESTAAIPVILLTAKVQPTDRSRFVDLGVTGIIAKPFDPLTLAEQVSAILGW